MVRGVGGKGLANIMRHIKGLRFPTTKEAIILRVQANTEEPGMPDTEQVLEVLHTLADNQSFATPAEILKAIKQQSKG